MSLDRKLVQEMNTAGRNLGLARMDNPKLGPLRWLPGRWENTEQLKGFGFNIMALPFAPSPNGYRVLMNQSMRS
jgi:hypothetical protein